MSVLRFSFLFLFVTTGGIFLDFCPISSYTPTGSGIETKENTFRGDGGKMTKKNTRVLHADVTLWGGNTRITTAIKVIQSINIIHVVDVDGILYPYRPMGKGLPTVNEKIRIIEPVDEFYYATHPDITVVLIDSPNA